MRVVVALRSLLDRVDRQRRRAHRLHLGDGGSLRVRSETGARTWLLVLAIASAVVVLLTFLFTTLVDEPASLVILAAIIALSVGIGPTWRQRRARAEPATGATA